MSLLGLGWERGARTISFCNKLISIALLFPSAPHFLKENCLLDAVWPVRKSGLKIPASSHSACVILTKSLNFSSLQSPLLKYRDHNI